jgi:CheY-like chemotaxis protein
MHGGTVEAHSEGEGRGSEFVVRLPLAAAGEPRPPAQETEAAALSPDRRRILVVDDNADSADSLGQLLTLLGHEVRTAYDGETGVAVATAFRPDVVLMDIGMPRLNGYDAARRIREEPWGGRVVLVALTGWGQDEDRRRSQEAGFDRHLVKPVEPEAVEALLADLRPPT